MCLKMSTHTHTHTFQRHGQTTCLSHSSFLKAVCPARTDNIWKTRLNESTHQLHQRILTSPTSLSRLTLLWLCLSFPHLFIHHLSVLSVHLFLDHSSLSSYSSSVAVLLGVTEDLVACKTGRFLTFVFNIYTLGKRRVKKKIGIVQYTRMSRFRACVLFGACASSNAERHFLPLAHKCCQLGIMLAKSFFVKCD